MAVCIDSKDDGAVRSTVIFRTAEEILYILPQHG